MAVLKRSVRFNDPVMEDSTSEHADQSLTPEQRSKSESLLAGSGISSINVNDGLRRSLSNLSLAVSEGDSTRKTPSKDKINRLTFEKILKYTNRLSIMLQELNTRKFTISAKQVKNVKRAITGNAGAGGLTDMELAGMAICTAYKMRRNVTKEWIMQKQQEACLDEFDCSMFDGKKAINQLRNISKLNVGAESVCQDAINALQQYQKNVEKIQGTNYLDRLLSSLILLMKGLGQCAERATHISNLEVILLNMKATFGDICQIIDDISAAANDDLIAKWLRGCTGPRDRDELRKRNQIYGKSSRISAITKGMLTKEKFKVPTLLTILSPEIRGCRAQKIPMLRDLRQVMKHLALAGQVAETSECKEARRRTLMAMNFLTCPGGIEGEERAKECLNSIRLTGGDPDIQAASRLIRAYDS